MSQFAARYTPIEASNGGFAAISVSGGAALLSTLVTIPHNANSAWIQVTAGTGLNHRSNGDTSGAEWLFLSPLQVLPLANRPWIDQLVVEASSGAVTLAITFFEGSIGPIPPVPRIEGGGSTPPPPPPGLLSLPTQNVVHVMKNGNDATGERDRLDKPFLTVDAGVAALGFDDTLMVWPGDYTSGGIHQIMSRMHYHIMQGATVTSSESFLNVGVSSPQSATITGGGKIKSTGYSSAIYCGTTMQTLFVDLAEVHGGIGDAITVLGGKAAIQADLYTAAESVGWGVYSGTSSGERVKVLSRGSINAANGIVAQMDSGITHYGDVTATNEGILTSGDSSVEVFGNVRVTNGTACAVDSYSIIGGIQVVYGMVSSELGVAARLEAGNQTIFGDCYSGGASAVECVPSTQGVNGVQTIIGNVTAEHGVAAVCSAGKQSIGGTVTSDNVAALCDGGEQLIYGNCETKATDAGMAAAHCNGGMQTVRGSARALESSVGSWCNGGAQTIHGESSSVLGTGAICGGGTQRILGLVSGRELGAYVEGGVQHLQCGISSTGIIATIGGGTAHYGGECSGPEMRPIGGVLTISGRVELSSSKLYVSIGADVTLAATAVIISTDPGIANSIDGDFGSQVKSLGAWTDKPSGPGVSVSGLLNVATFAL